MRTKFIAISVAAIVALGLFSFFYFRSPSARSSRTRCPIPNPLEAIMDLRARKSERERLDENYEMRLLADQREARWKAGRREIAWVRKGLSDAAVTVRPLHRQKSMLERLPPELRSEIYSYLDYGMLLSLARTSRFFHDDTPEETIPTEQRATYVFHAESFPRNKNRLACFGCLKLLPSSKFLLPQRTGEYGAFGRLELERLCFECACKRGEGEKSVLERLLQWSDGFSRRITGMKPL